MGLRGRIWNLEINTVAVLNTQFLILQCLWYLWVISFPALTLYVITLSTCTYNSAIHSRNPDTLCGPLGFENSYLYLSKKKPYSHTLENPLWFWNFSFSFQRVKKISKNKRAPFNILNISNLKDICLDYGNSLEGVLDKHCLCIYSAY